MSCKTAINAINPFAALKKTEKPRKVRMSTGKKILFGAILLVGIPLLAGCGGGGGGAAAAVPGGSTTTTTTPVTRAESVAFSPKNPKKGDTLYLKVTCPEGTTASGVVTKGTGNAAITVTPNSTTVSGTTTNIEFNPNTFAKGNVVDGTGGCSKAGTTTEPTDAEPVTFGDTPTTFIPATLDAEVGTPVKFSVVADDVDGKPSSMVLWWKDGTKKADGTDKFYSENMVNTSGNTWELEKTFDVDWKISYKYIAYGTGSPKDMTDEAILEVKPDWAGAEAIIAGQAGSDGFVGTPNQPWGPLALSDSTHLEFTSGLVRIEHPDGMRTKYVYVYKNETDALVGVNYDGTPLNTVQDLMNLAAALAASADPIDQQIAKRIAFEKQVPRAQLIIDTNTDCGTWY